MVNEMNKNKKRTAYIPLLIAALSYVMISPNTVIGTPGDYVLSTIGISPYSGGYNARYNLHVGRHNTPYVFGFTLLTALLYLAYEVMKKNRIGRFEAVTAFVLSVVVLNVGIVASSSYVIGNSEGLNTIRHNPGASRFEYQIAKGDMESFDVMLNLKNFSDESKKFYVSFKNAYQNNLGSREIAVLDKNGEPAVFELSAESNELLHISSEDFQLEGWNYLDQHHKAICIQELHLTNETGEKLILTSNKH